MIDDITGLVLIFVQLKGLEMAHGKKSIQKTRKTRHRTFCINRPRGRAPGPFLNIFACSAFLKIQKLHRT